MIIAGKKSSDDNNKRDMAIRTEGYPLWTEQFNCSKWSPCPLDKMEGDKKVVDDSVLVDWDGFYGRWALQRIVGKVVGKESLTIWIWNWDRGRDWDEEVVRDLKGVEVKVEFGERVGCGGWEEECEGNGECVKEDGEEGNEGEVVCRCKDGWGGRFCEREIKVLRENKSEEIEFVGEVEGVLKVGEQKLYSYIVPEFEHVSQISVVSILRFSHVGVYEHDMEMIVKRAGVGATEFLKTPLILPSSNDVMLGSIGIEKNEGDILLFNVAKELSTKEEMAILVVNNASKRAVRGNINFTLQAFPCSVTGHPTCPGDNNEAITRASVLIVPMCLGALSILSATVGILLWADRRAHRSPNRHDRLSRKELCVMAPAFAYVKRTSPPSASTSDDAVGSAPGADSEGEEEEEEEEEEDNGCSICLCDFENGDRLRRLRCDHCFHADCVDPWMVSNATCPTCREPARIEELSERWPLRYLWHQILDRWEGRRARQLQSEQADVQDEESAIRPRGGASRRSRSRRSSSIQPSAEDQTSASTRQNGERHVMFHPSVLAGQNEAYDATDQQSEEPGKPRSTLTATANNDAAASSSGDDSFASVLTHFTTELQTSSLKDTGRRRQS